MCLETIVRFAFLVFEWLPNDFISPRSLRVLIAFDVVKTRMQGLEASKYKSTLDCVKTMLRTEGPLVFYSGVVPRLGRVIPGQGVIFMSYDSIHRAVSSFLDEQ